MTKEEKQLLFKDLSARLPYHIRVKVWLKDGTTEEGMLDLEHNYGDVLRDAFYYNKIVDIKPYLRPMSSMTEEEFAEYEKANDLDTLDSSETLRENMKAKARVRISKWYHGTDWLNAHHFDYRGLISKGLAIEVTEERIN